MSSVESEIGDRLALTAQVSNVPDGCEPEIAWDSPTAPVPVMWEDSGLGETAATLFAAGDYVVRAIARCPDGEATDEAPVVATATPNASDAAELAEAPRQLHATIHSIGTEWDLDGDADHDAFGAIGVRAQGTERWLGSLPLVRIDYQFDPNLNGHDLPGNEPRDWNMLAGSALFLEPGVTYDVRVMVADPDGGFAVHDESITMRDEPVVPDDAPRRYVVPGNGGGSGTEDDPFRGIDAADAAAMPGDVFVLGPGQYGIGNFDRSGEAGSPVVWLAEGDGVQLAAGRVGGDHVWLVGLHFVRAGQSSGIRTTRSNVHHVVVSQCDFDGFHYSITTNGGAYDWTIVDNVMVGDNDPSISDYSGEGVELLYSSGHVVAYNRISQTADGVSYMRRNCDVYGNDIFATSDDGIEPDFGLANNRMWGNRIYDIHNNGLSFQPQRSGPWYFLYNQVVIDGLWVFKFNGQVDRSVLIHNTFVNGDNHLAQRAHPLLTSQSRNNLYVADNPVLFNAPPFNATEHVPDSSFYAIDWRADLDHDGFAWDAQAGTDPFRWNGTDYDSLEAWSRALGIEPNGLALTLADIGDLSREVLTLPDTSAAVDAGVDLAPIHRSHPVLGAGPDLGAHESGGPPASYGPRQ